MDEKQTKSIQGFCPTNQSTSQPTHSGRLINVMDKCNGGGFKAFIKFTFLMNWLTTEGRQQQKLNYYLCLTIQQKVILLEVRIYVRAVRLEGISVRRVLNKLASGMSDGFQSPLTLPTSRPSWYKPPTSSLQRAFKGNEFASSWNYCCALWKALMSTIKPDVQWRSNLLTLLRNCPSA